MRACDDEEGSPSHHVMRSQTIAPKRPAATTVRVIAPGSTTPFPMVVATLVSKKNAAMKLKNAAQRTAC